MNTKLIDTSDEARKRAADAVNDAMDITSLMIDYVNVVINALTIPTQPPAAGDVERVARMILGWANAPSIDDRMTECRALASSILHDRPAASKETPEGCVRVRVAVAVDPSGYWSASGWSTDDGHDHAMELAVDGTGDGESRYWLTACLPVPKVVEVAASVEGGE